MKDCYQPQCHELRGQLANERAASDQLRQRLDYYRDEFAQVRVFADLLARVRAAVQVSEVQPYAEWHSLTIDGPEQPLRELAEALRRDFAHDAIDAARGE